MLENWHCTSQLRTEGKMNHLKRGNREPDWEEDDKWLQVIEKKWRNQWELHVRIYDNLKGGSSYMTSPLEGGGRLSAKRWLTMTWRHRRGKARKKWHTRTKRELGVSKRWHDDKGGHGVSGSPENDDVIYKQSLIEKFESLKILFLHNLMIWRSWGVNWSDGCDNLRGDGDYN